MQNNRLPTKSHVKLEDNTIIEPSDVFMYFHVSLDMFSLQGLQLIFAQGAFCQHYELVIIYLLILDHRSLFIY